MALIRFVPDTKNQLQKLFGVEVIRLFHVVKIVKLLFGAIKDNI